MSSTRKELWPIVIRTAFAGLLLSLCAPLAAQSDAESPNRDNRDNGKDERVVIDLLAQSQGQYGPPPPIEDCTEEQEAAIISGEIIVCRRITDQSEFRTIDPDGAQARYAAETAYANDPQAPNVAGGGIFRGPATASGLCFIPPCPKEAALIIDVSELPEAPPGSDADRIARGLPPLGNDEGAPPSQSELVGQPEGPVTLTTGNYTHRGGPAETTRETTRETTPAESEAPEAD